MRGDEDVDVCELPKLVDHKIDSLRIVSSRIEDCFGVVEDEKHRLGREIRSQCCQILRVLDPSTDNLGKAVKEMGARHLELIAAHEPSFFTEFPFDSLMVGDGQGQG